MQKSPQDIFVQLLRDYAKHIQTLSQEEFEDLLTGVAKIELKTSRCTKNRVYRKKEKAPEVELSKHRSTLENMKTREEGELFLSRICKSKDDLIYLTKYLDIPVQKSDKLDRLKDKIIEATIGYRVRSAAIQKSASNV